MQQLYIFHLLFGTVIVMKTINSQRNEKKTENLKHFSASRSLTKQNLSALMFLLIRTKIKLRNLSLYAMHVYVLTYISI